MPKSGVWDEPKIGDDADASGKKADADAIKKHLANIDADAVKRERAKHDNVLDTMQRKIDKTKADYDAAVEKQRTAKGSGQVRAANKAHNEALKAYEDAQREARYYRTGDENWNNLKASLAIDENKPAFMRLAMGGKSDESHIAAVESAKRWLKANGHDERIADAVVGVVRDYPIRASEDLGKIIADETTRQKMKDERAAATDFVKTLDMMPHHNAEAEREAGNLYAGDLDRFKEKWTKEGRRTSRRAGPRQGD
jgi:hypothetical protein